MKDIKDLLLYVQQQEEEETNKWAGDIPKEEVKIRLKNAII